MEKKRKRLFRDKPNDRLSGNAFIAAFHNYQSTGQHPTASKRLQLYKRKQKRKKNDIDVANVESFNAYVVSFFLRRLALTWAVFFFCIFISESETLSSFAHSMVRINIRETYRVGVRLQLLLWFDWAGRLKRAVNDISHKYHSSLRRHKARLFVHYNM